MQNRVREIKKGDTLSAEQLADEYVRVAEEMVEFYRPVNQTIMLLCESSAKDFAAELGAHFLSNKLPYEVVDVSVSQWSPECAVALMKQMDLNDRHICILDANNGKSLDVIRSQLIKQKANTALINSAALVDDKLNPQSRFQVQVQEMAKTQNNNVSSIFNPAEDKTRKENDDGRMYNLSSPNYI